MSFLAPLMLIGAIGLAVPVIIHLIGRHRAKVVRFAALEFLFATKRKTARRLRLREWLLLLVRGAICVAIPLALAKPFTRCTASGPRLERGPQAAVLVIDDSFASGYLVGGETMLSRAVFRARRIIQELGPSAEVAVLRASSTSDRAIELTRDHLRVRDQLRDLIPSSRPADLSRTLTRAAQLLAGSSQQRRTVFLLSTMPRYALAGDPPWGEDGPALIAIDLAAGKPLPNLAVTSIAAAPDPSVSDRGIAVSAEVGNFGAEPVTNRELSLRISGRVVAKSRVDIPAGQKVSKRFHAVLPADARFADAVVALEDDALAVDDQRYARVYLRDEVRVLLVNGQPRTVRHDDELFYLETALRPGDRGDAGIQLTVTTVDGLAGLDLAPYDAVVLANVPALDKDRVTAISEWVAAGGGLWVTLGDNVDPAAYARTMSPLLPQAVLDPIDVAWKSPRQEQRSRALHLTKWESDHPIFAPFPADAPGLRDASFTRIHLLGPSSSNARNVLARFTNGAAALVEDQRGAGRLLLWTSTIDRDGNDLPIHPGYLPLVQQAVHHLARRHRSGERAEVLVGRSVALPTSDFLRLEVRSPDGASTVFEGDRLDGRSAVRFHETTQPGIYRVLGAGPKGQTESRDELSFAVNLDSRGSDLTRLDDAQLPRSGTAQSAASGESTRRLELWHAVAAILLLLLVLESVLIQR